LQGYEILTNASSAPGIPDPANNEQRDAPPLGYAIAQLAGIYILAHSDRGLVVVDMHAAHERILYEQLKNAYDEKQVVRQPWLVPVTVEVSECEAERAEQAGGVFGSLALKLARGGPASVIVREIPALL